MSTPTTAPAPLSIVRRLGLLVLGLAIVVTGLGLGSSPASASAPTQPQAILAAGYEDIIRVYFSPPALIDEDAPVTGYQLERTAQGHPTKLYNRADTAPFVDTTAVLNVDYTYRVRASSAHGWSPWSEISVAERNLAYDQLDPFASTAAFVNRQYQDFLGRPPTNAERNNAVANIDAKAWTPGTLINMLVGQSVRTPRHQIIRLYNAYFDRNADHAGLDYWFDQITTKGKSINTVSNSFAGSNEFKVMYGNLSNAQYVTLVFQNVLDRNPTPADLAYWKGQLDQKIINRGRMMTLFSESPEYKELSRGLVLAADVYDAMLHQASAGSELVHWSSHIQAGGNPGDYGARIMLLNSY